MSAVIGNGLGIVGLGAHLPEEVRTNDWWAVPPDAGFMAETAGSVPGGTVERYASLPFAGTQERRIMAEAHASSDMEVDASRMALASAELDMALVDLLIGYSQVSDDPGPGNHGRVARGLGLAHQATAFTLDAGCAGFITQLNVAVRLIAAGDASRALLYQSSASSRILDPADDASWLLGDGAVAQVVGPVPPGCGFVGREQRMLGELCEGLVLAPSDKRRRWVDPGEPGSRMLIQARDRRAAIQMGAAGPTYAHQTCKALLDRFDLTADAVDFFVCPQPTIWFADACAEAIGVAPGRWLPPSAHFQQYGHLLVGSVGLNLLLAWRLRLLRTGDLVLLYSPGVGFTQAAVLLRWALEPSRPRPPASPRVR